jgi:hypothetical protein
VSNELQVNEFISLNNLKDITELNIPKINIHFNTEKNEIKN